MSVPQKYGLLRVIAFILKLLAWVVLVAGLVGLIVLLIAFAASGGSQPAWMRAVAAAGLLAVPIAAIVWFVQLFAFGSIISLLIDIEENTRALAAPPPAP